MSFFLLRLRLGDDVFSGVVCNVKVTLLVANTTLDFAIFVELVIVGPLSLRYFRKGEPARRSTLK